MIHQIRQRNGDKNSYRLYAVQIENTTLYWAAKTRTEDEFQQDMREFTSTHKDLDPASLEHSFNKYMHGKKYIPVSDLVSDAFAARILHTRSRLIPQD